MIISFRKFIKYWSGFFYSRGSLVGHYKLHHDKEEALCKDCGKILPNQYKLKAHISYYHAYSKHDSLFSTGHSYNKRTSRVYPKVPQPKGNDFATSRAITDLKTNK